MFKAELTVEEARSGMANIQPKIERYADLIVRKGVHVKPGQEVVVQAPVEVAPFVRLLVGRAYAAGAGHVTVIWSDDEVTRLTYENVETSWFEQGIDPAKPAAASKARNTQCAKYRHGMDFNINPWCIAGAPVAAWARQVYPGVEDEIAVYRLWCSILSVARADGDDPEAAWELHNATFEKNLRFLNDRHFDRLHYTSSNGTDLWVGMTDKHVWEGGSSVTPDGHQFFPNIPTEEVFTSPHCERVDGIVYSALPLVRHGNKIDRFWLRFENGSVVDFDAEVGRETLASILNTDDGARRLGEVALISKNTPIRETDTLFYDTLYDENASCHLALGSGFPECYEGGYDMSQEDLRACGMNKSGAHVDFMIGADDLDITGVTAEGEEVPVFVNGQWTWE